MQPKYVVIMLIVLAFVLSTVGVMAQSPNRDTLRVGGCVPGETYDPACDVDHDGDVDIFDIQLAAGHWNQGGTYTSGSWDLTGNAGTNPTSNFLGTTDAVTLTLAVSNTAALRLVPVTSTLGYNFPNILSGDSHADPGVVGVTIFGNFGNHASAGAELATIGGGGQNQVGGPSATISGGWDNSAGGDFSTVSGGLQNSAHGNLATVCGGYGNAANGQGSFAAGQRAHAYHDGTFVWADSSDYVPYESTAPNQFLIRATGGVGIGTNAPQSALQVVGNYIQFPTITGAPPITDCDEAIEGGRMVVRIDGPQDLYICKGVAGWVSQ